MQTEKEIEKKHTRIWETKSLLGEKMGIIWCIYTETIYICYMSISISRTLFHVMDLLCPSRFLSFAILPWLTSLKAPWTRTCSVCLCVQRHLCSLLLFVLTLLVDKTVCCCHEYKHWNTHTKASQHYVRILYMWMACKWASKHVVFYVYVCIFTFTAVRLRLPVMLLLLYYCCKICISMYKCVRLPALFLLHTYKDVRWIDVQRWFCVRISPYWFFQRIVCRFGFLYSFLSFNRFNCNPLTLMA